MKEYHIYNILSPEQCKIGNPLLEFNTDFNSRAEFLWSHGLISDCTYKIFTTVCNFSQIRRQYASGSLSFPCSKSQEKSANMLTLMMLLTMSVYHRLNRNHNF
ncbi:hypothetical protein SADUNF_Sadunf16G0031000 [Salix dunnii]|uniref:Uncharacterized protein n=1 Tax=Salix dunnii TaxID=1413687 RepID=A0A835J7N8_9ROSI|nr:hypothetical protein SADUNF_Sadunf16G0031000 [Salix dunnii]